MVSNVRNLVLCRVCSSTWWHSYTPGTVLFCVLDGINFYETDDK